eukprot:s1572_g9.t1
MCSDLARGGTGSQRTAVTVRSPTWIIPISQFVDQNCLIFEDQEENKLEYTLVHNSFKQLVEDLLAAHLVELDITTDEFTSFCEYGMSGSNELHRSLVEQLISVEDFLVFKAMMLKRNSELSREALQPFVSHIVIADSDSPPPPPAPPGEEGCTTPPEINGETEAERLMRLEAEQRCVEAELQLAIALSRHLEKRLQLIEALNEVLEMAQDQGYAMDAEESSRKAALRKKVWDALEENDAVLFPRPCHGRIPNCAGSAVACGHLLQLPAIRNAAVVKVHPSIGAAALRTALVMAKKTVLVPPYPGADFLYLLLHHSLAPSASALQRAGDKREYMKWARPLQLLDACRSHQITMKYDESKGLLLEMLSSNSLDWRFIISVQKRRSQGHHSQQFENIRESFEEIPPVDVVVVATCVVANNGVRLGKGKGYGEVEWGILTELGAVDESVPVYTLCHDLQVVRSEDLPADMMESHDLPVDAFATPSGVTKCEAKAMPRKPFGVRWDLVGADLEHDIGALRELRGLDPQALAAHRAAAAARRSSAPIADQQTAEEWKVLTDACVSRFAAEEAKSEASNSYGPTTPSLAQLSAQAESMSAQAEAEAAQEAALQAAQIIQQHQELLPATLQMRPLDEGPREVQSEEDSAERCRIDETATVAVKVRAARRAVCSGGRGNGGIFAMGISEQDQLIQNTAFIGLCICILLFVAGFLMLGTAGLLTYLDRRKRMAEKDWAGKAV